MTEFLVTFPVWLLVTEDSVVRDNRGKPIGLTDRPGFKIIRDPDRLRLSVFTDEDLANRHMAGAPGRWAPLGIDRPAALVECLRKFQAAGGTSVVFDPEPAGTSYTVEAVIASLEKGQQP